MVFVVQSDALLSIGSSIQVKGIIDFRGAASRVQCRLYARGDGGLCVAFSNHVILVMAVCGTAPERKSYCYDHTNNGHNGLATTTCQCHRKEQVYWQVWYYSMPGHVGRDPA